MTHVRSLCRLRINRLVILLAMTIAGPLAAQQTTAVARPKPADTEVWSPEPRIVTPGASDAAAPADAIVLFDGKNLDQWISAHDSSAARWVVANGIVTVNKPSGDIQTRRSFSNYQLHIEWRIPDGSLATPAYVTAFHNGVLVQNHVALKGVTKNTGYPEYKPHGPAPILLQAHGDKSAPISFRNIWARVL